jgi:hypothetical protein
MAIIMEPRVDSNNRKVPWDPASISPSKPFINISTTPSDSLTPFEEMNFIKTQSPIYSPFHKTTRTVHFDVGYSNKAKWLETINDKWSEYSSFYVAGFLEDIYSINSTDGDTGTAYAQINARIIDFDSRFRHGKASTSTTSFITSPKSTSTFAKRRLTASTTTTPTTTTPTTTKSPATTKSPTTTKPRTTIISTPPPNENDNQLNDNDSDHSIQSIPSDPQSPNPISTHVITPVTQTRQTRKRRQLSNLCDTDEEPINDDPTPPPPPKKRVNKKRITKEDPIIEDETTPKSKSTTTKGRKRSGC